MYNVKEVDSFHLLEDRMICFVKVRDGLLLRGLSPRHDRGRKRQELGRPCMLRAITEKEETAATEPALEEITNQVEPGVGMYQAVTQVKV